MNKVLKNILGGLVLAVILIVFYLSTFQLSQKRLVIKEATSIVSVGDLDSKKMKSYYELYEKATKIDSKDVKKYTKYVKGLDLIYYNESLPNEKTKDNEVMAINLGWRYPMAKFKQGDYFDSLGKNYFSLKEVYQKQLFEKYGVEKKIYMTNYKGYYFIADDVMKLSDYMRLLVKKEMNKNITKVMKGDTLGEAVVDLGNIAEGLTSLKINLDYEKSELVLNGYVYGDIEFSKYFDNVDSKDRKFSNYMGKNRIYMTNKNFKEMSSFLIDNLDPSVKSTLSVVKMFTGKTLEEYIGQIDGELVYDYQSDQMILPVKETKDFEDLLNILAKKDGENYVLGNGKIIEIKDNVIYYNGEMSEGDIVPKKDEFISGSLNLGMYKLNLMDLYLNVGGKIEKKWAKIRVSIKEEDLLEVYKRMGVE
jgi:hypothetical protein